MSTLKNETMLPRADLPEFRLSRVVPCRWKPHIVFRGSPSSWVSLMIALKALTGMAMTLRDQYEHGLEAGVGPLHETLLANS